MSRLPIRLRLTLAFTVAIALLLGTGGAFVYERQRSDLDEQIERELSARLAGVAAIIVDDGDDLGDPAQDPLERVDEEGFVQVLDEQGTVADATAEALKADPLLTPAQVDELVRGERKSIDATVASLGGEELRLAAEFSRDDGTRYTAIVGASLEGRNETLASLSKILAVGGPIALLLASALAYLLVSAAIRPVEAMRARAARISGDRRGERLPVPRARDEIASLGETLNEMLDRIERAFDRERAFVSDASHELRTPLTILKAELDLALKAGRSREELLTALQSASDETDRLSKLADDLLVLARADEGRLPLDPSEIEARDLLARVADRFAPVAGELGRQIEVRSQPGTKLVADPARVDQALSNLVQNGLRHGRGRITLSDRAGTGWIELVVHDEGELPTPDFGSVAFERFTRGDGRSPGGGAGLGLAIVAAIAGAHGGSARMLNSPDGGVEASIRLPTP
jgi:two-component system, OmpR family, sensor kinase